MAENCHEASRSGHYNSMNKWLNIIVIVMFNINVSLQALKVNGLITSQLKK